MWPPWLRSPSHTRSTPPPSPARTASRSLSFSCSSFKDIQRLCQDQPEPEPTAPRSPSLFRRVRISTAVLRALGNSRSGGVSSNSVVAPPGSDQGAVVVYYTSLRVVRRTFEDCRAVRSILRGYRVSIDERDVSMDNRFLDEIHGILGRKNVTLPRVFVGGKYIGGADDVKQLNETGDLRRLIERLPRTDPNACNLCGGLRFVVCDECSGSHKVYMEKTGFRSCTSCNVNGLIRCPSCSFMHPRHTK